LFHDLEAKFEIGGSDEMAVEARLDNLTMCRP
jgi:hypothetical protein